MREGWITKTLGEIGKIASGKSIPSSDIVDTFSNGLFPCYGGNGLRGYVNKYTYDGRYPIIGRVGALCGNVHLAEGKFYPTEHALVMSLKNGDNPYFIKYLLLSLGLNSFAKGVAQPVLSAGTLSRISVPIPPLQEQEKIVAELDLLTEIIDKQKQLLKELDTLAQSIFYDMFGNPEENTKCWRTEKFQTICTSLFAGGDVPKDNYSETKSETYNVPILSNGVGDKAVYGYTNKARVFDECVTISGRGTIGYCEVRSEPFFPVVRLIVAVPNKDILLPIVLKYIVDSLHLHGVGVAIPQLTIPMVKNVSIILPSMEMQCLFAKIIQSIESQKKSITRSIAESQKLFDYTMDKYFG